MILQFFMIYTHDLPHPIEVTTYHKWIPVIYKSNTINLNFIKGKFKSHHYQRCKALKNNELLNEVTFLGRRRKMCSHTFIPNSTIAILFFLPAIFSDIFIIEATIAQFISVDKHSASNTELKPQWLDFCSVHMKHNKRASKLSSHRPFHFTPLNTKK